MNVFFFFESNESINFLIFEELEKTPQKYFNGQVVDKMLISLQTRIKKIFTKNETWERQEGKS